ncbi:hypothetical protein HZS_3483 [Henneguya salminicola]|nr:hypothetical protein HZS_3483 [Henneguya salminicola]
MSSANFADLSVRKNRKRSKAEILREIDNSFAIDDYQHYDLNYIDTLSMLIPTGIPRHNLFGESKLKIKNDNEKCLFLIFSSIIDFSSSKALPLRIVDSFTHITKEMCDSLSKMISNGRKFGVSADKLSILIDAINLFYNELNTWMLFKYIIVYSFNNDQLDFAENHDLKDSITNLFTQDGRVKFYNVSSSTEKVDGYSVVDYKEIYKLQTYKLWRDSALRLSNDRNANQFERALYGFFCGNIDSILPVCSTYNDFLWSQLLCSVYLSVETEVLKCINSPQTINNIDSNIKNEKFNLGHIFKNAKKLVKEDMTEVLFYKKIQKWIILADPNIGAKIKKRVHAWQENKDMLRFLVHFVLMYKNFVPIDDEILALVISFYIESLIQLKKYPILALYVSFMPAVCQVNRYVEILNSIKPRQDKLEFINFAKKYGIYLSKFQNYGVVPDHVLIISSYQLCFDAIDALEYVLSNDNLLTPIYFPTAKTEGVQSSNNVCDVTNILDRIVLEATKLVKISEKLSLILTKHHFEQIKDIPYTGYDFKENSLKILSKYTFEVINVLYSVNHYREDHIKCLQVSHLIARFSRELIKTIPKIQLKQLIQHFSDCFTFVDFSHNPT